jgi:hypothetical protein
MSPVVTLLRRTVWIVLLAVAGAAAWAWWRERASDPSPAPPPEWPPFPTAPPAPPAAPAAPAAIEGPWVAPNPDGSCPDGFAVKVKVASGIYHVPGGRFHERTRPDRCYATAEGAEADGYRRSKS